MSLKKFYIFHKTIFINTHIIADFAVISVGAGAVELVDGLVDEIGPTSAAVLTSVALTTDQLDRTVFAPVFRLAGAEVISSAVGANPVLARIVSLALVDLVLTVITLVALVALACVAADAIHASARTARVAVALVDVHLAILAGDTLHAEALVPVEKELAEVLRYFEETNERKNLFIYENSPAGVGVTEFLIENRG